MGRRRGPPLIVLDTHAWLWFHARPDRLSRRARSLIDRDGVIGVAAISCWELVMLERQSRIRFDAGASTWLRRALAREDTVALDLTPEIAIRAGQVYPALSDPADAIVYATAVQHDAPLVTRDDKLLALDPTRTVW